MDTKKKGFLGESIACDLLIAQDYKILQRNYSCKLGEIDIIALKDNTLIFVEVKTRSNKKYGVPQEAVTPQKLRKIQKVSEFYRLSHKNLPVRSRIDVVAIEIDQGNIKSSQIIPVI